MKIQFLRFVPFFLILLIGKLSIASEIVNFDQVLNKAIEHSFDLRAANIDFEIKNNDTIQAFVSRFPELSFNFTSGYTMSDRSKAANKKRAQFWRYHIDVWSRSELAQNAYCRTNNLKPNLTYWKNKFKKQNLPVEFVQIP